MSVTRVDPVSMTSTRYRRQLGHVRVTVDDLAALADLLVELGEPDDEIRFEFDGGGFDSPADLRLLSDVELQTIRVSAPNLQVQLSRTRADAVGGYESAERVYRLWARPRQTRMRPPGYFAMGSTVGGLVLVVGLIAGLTYLVFPSVRSLVDATDATDSVWSAIALFVLGCGLALMGVSVRHILRGGTSYAVNLPLSLADHQQHR